MSQALTVVGIGKSATIPNETLAQRIQQLQAEAKNLAKSHVSALIAHMVDLEAIAAEIADGGDAYSPGIRDVARRLAEDLDARVQTIEAIVARS